MFLKTFLTQYFATQLQFSSRRYAVGQRFHLNQQYLIVFKTSLVVYFRQILIKNDNN